jgi:hypothetical protein
MLPFHSVVLISKKQNAGRTYTDAISLLLASGSCNCWHHQKAYLLRAGADEASQGGARGRGHGETQDGLRPGHV